MACDRVDRDSVMTMDATTTNTERFNALMIEFLDDLSSTFDEHQCLKLLHGSVEKMVEDNGATPLPACAFHSFVGGITKGEMKAKMPVILEAVQKMATHMGLEVDVKEDYQSSDDDTKEAIRTYIANLIDLSSALVEAGKIATIQLDSLESIMSSVSALDPSVAEQITQSMMCLVPTGLREFVDDKVKDCQRQIESGNMSTTDILDQIKGSIGQLN